jgi:hypothetical protein
MHIFKPKDFARAARKAALTDTDLRAAVQRAENGMIDADLGHGLIKQRIPRENQGRSSGFRSILVYRRGRLAIFIHLFAKSSRANVSDAERLSLEKLAKELNRLTALQISDLIQTGRWEEIAYDKSE